MDIKAFRGLNNVTDPLRLGLDWLVQADNVNVTSTGSLVSREGYSQSLVGNYTAIYSTQDYQRCYVVKAGVLQTFEGAQLITLISNAQMFWAEVNGQVFFNNGTDSGVILPDNTVLPWAWATPTPPAVSASTGNLPAGVYQVRCSFVLPDGRETGTGDSAEIYLDGSQALVISNIPQAGGVTNVYIAPANSDVYQLAYVTVAKSLTFNGSIDTLGRDLLNAFLDPLPAGSSVIQHWKGCIYAAQYMPNEKQTVVWFTEPLGFHLFNLNSNFFIVPGQVLMLAPHDDALIIGTDARVFAYTGDKLQELADYGVIPGQHWAEDDDRILFWTLRGLCAALPFKNLTERQVSVAPGLSAGGAIVRSGGQKRYVVALHAGGYPFNAK
jgi:hypothetical protein